MTEHPQCRRCEPCTTPTMRINVHRISLKYSCTLFSFPNIHSIIKTDIKILFTYHSFVFLLAILTFIYIVIKKRYHKTLIFIYYHDNILYYMKATKITIEQCICVKCSFSWFPRLTKGKKPLACPNCKSRNWLKKVGDGN